jgi:hypothetical protein
MMHGMTGHMKPGSVASGDPMRWRRAVRAGASAILAAS